MQGSVADLYPCNTDPYPGSTKFGYGPVPDRTQIRIRKKIIRMQIQAEKVSVPGKSLKLDFKKRSYSMFCVFILRNYHHFSVNNHLNQVLKKLIFCFQWFLLDPHPYNFLWIQIPDPAQLLIRIQGNNMGSTDPDPQH